MVSNLELEAVGEILSENEHSYLCTNENGNNFRKKCRTLNSTNNKLNAKRMRDELGDVIGDENENRSNLVRRRTEKANDEVKP